MKIALVICPVWQTKTPSLGMSYLASYLEKNGHNTYVFDFNIELYHKVKNKQWWNFDISESKKEALLNEYTFRKNNFLNNEINSWINQIFSVDCSIICFSTYSESREFSIEMARRIKNRDKNKVIIFGGPVCSSKIDDVLWFKHNKDNIDIIVEGEGEETLLELVNCIEKNKPIKKCNGALVQYMGRIIISNKRKPIQNLDRLPFPDFSQFPLEKYSKRNLILISGSRGCFGNCVFCKDKLIWRAYRYRSAQNIFSEILIRVKQGYDSFEFCDSILNGNLKQIENLCYLIIKNKLKIHWGGPIRCSKDMTLKIFQKMKKAGVGCLNIGIESGSQTILNKMKKGYTIDIIEKNLRDMHKAGIKSSINIIVGFPNENEETLKETKSFIIRNRKYIKHVSSLTPLYLIPHTPLMRASKKYQIKIGDDVYNWSSIDGKNTYNWRIGLCNEIYNLIKALGIETECNQYKRELNRVCA